MVRILAIVLFLFGCQSACIQTAPKEPVVPVPAPAIENRDWTLWEHDDTTWEMVVHSDSFPPAAYFELLYADQYEGQFQFDEPLFLNRWNYPVTLVIEVNGEQRVYTLGG